MNLGAPEIGLIILAALLFFGHKQLPDASRSIGRSLRIFKGEMNALREDGDGQPPVALPAGDVDRTGSLLTEASAGEARAAQLPPAEQAAAEHGSEKAGWSG